MEIQPIETLTYIDCSEADGGTSCKFTFPYGEGEAYAYFGYDGEQWIAAWVIDAKFPAFPRSIRQTIRTYIKLQQLSIFSYHVSFPFFAYWIGHGLESTLPPGYGK